MQKSITFYSQQYEDLLKKVNDFQKENKSYKERIQILENNIDQLERSSKCSTVEIRNIPLSPAEDKTTLCTHIINLRRSREPAIQDHDVRDIFRIKSKSGAPGPIIMELSTSSIKERFIKSVISFNKGKPKNGKLNSTHLKLKGTPKPVYVSDCLTNRARRLHYLAREFKKKHNYSSCWTAYGKVYLRKSEESTPIRIEAENDLNKLMAI
ncbi:hypothetical protein NE865_16398 [Phthorimaea operculella]|nr:hypothetical protein NE865_16398 [Phthorimaea operculella]